jgi:lipopolysaccharide/colanic/teichoic acid biosynthesis glycosyltransferase
MQTEEIVNPLFSIEPFYSKKIRPWKRIIDIIGSLTGMVMMSPLFLFIFLLIKLLSPGPIFFKQERIGYGGKKFKFYKFRTMKPDIDTSLHEEYFAKLIESGANSECSGDPMCKIEKDPRIIPFGNILRKSYLDEIPQLYNVLRGEMSLVGPRPPIPYEVERYSSWHYERFECLPGMTGIWQISGKNRLTFKEMVRLDIQYSRHLSFLFDLKILFKTPFAIIFELMDHNQMVQHSSLGAKTNV